jgi:hypothetical protein
MHLTDSAITKPMFSKMVSFAEETANLLVAIAVVVSLNPRLLFRLLTPEEVSKLATLAGSYFLANFKGSLSESITLGSNSKWTLAYYDPCEIPPNRVLNSSVIIIFAQISQCLRDKSMFLSIFNLFEVIWQRVIQMTDDSITLGCCLKVSRLSVKIAVQLGEKDPSQRIFSTICGIAVPTSAAFPLASKGVVALHSMIRLLQHLSSKLMDFWPLIFETLSRCHHRAAHKRSHADLQALGLIKPTLVTFSVDFDDQQFFQLFSVILKLSQEEVVNFIGRHGTVPNFWPIKTLCHIFVLNLHRTQQIEQFYFRHVQFIMNCESGEFRCQITITLFDVAKEVINCAKASPTSRQSIFDFIFQAAISPNSAVAITAFSSISGFLAGGTAQHIQEGWPMVLTVLKIVWATPFPEQIPENMSNGFRALTFVCGDCLRFLKENDIEVCLSTISSYISQVHDLNIALGSIGLLWNVGSALNIENSNSWKLLLKTLQIQFKDSRGNVRDSSLQTFFNLINTFNGQFSADLKQYILEQIIAPLVEFIQEIESAILAIQGVTQCLRSLGDYETVIGTLLSSIEELSKRDNNATTAAEATRCYTPLFFFDDQELSKQTTMAVLRTIKVYVSMPNTYDLQGAASVVTSVFPKISPVADDDEFRMWLEIIDLFATFQTDRPYLHVATHSTLNIFLGLPKLEEKRMLLIVRHLMEFVEVEYAPLAVKAFEILGDLYAQSLDDDGRSKSLQLQLPMIQPRLASAECVKCFQKLIERPLSLRILMRDDATVLRLIEIARRYEGFKFQLAVMMCTNMNLMSSGVFNAFLSLGKEIQFLYLTYFRKFCGIDDPDVEFALRTKETVRSSIAAVIRLLIKEERALGSILNRERYVRLTDFLKGLSELRTSPDIFEARRNDGHFMFLIQPMIQLSETRCDELRIIVQRILSSMSAF